MFCIVYVWTKKKQKHEFNETKASKESGIRRNEFKDHAWQIPCTVEPCNNRLKFRSILTEALSFWDGNTMKSGFWFVATVFSFCMFRGEIHMIRHMRKWHLIKRHFVECIDWRLFIGTIDKIEIMISLLAFHCSKEVNGIFFDLLISIPEKSAVFVTKFHSNHIFTAN